MINNKREALVTKEDFTQASSIRMDGEKSYFRAPSIIPASLIYNFFREKQSLFVFRFPGYWFIIEYFTPKAPSPPHPGTSAPPSTISFVTMRHIS